MRAGLARMVMAIGMAVLGTCVPGLCGDVEVKLDSTDGASAFVVQDSNAVAHVSIKSDGWVGIGITNPHDKLEIFNGRLIMNGLAPISTDFFTGLGFQYYISDCEGAIMSSCNDAYGYLSFYTKAGTGEPIRKQVIISRHGDLAVDQGNLNDGGFNNGTLGGAGLSFGSNSGEGIASKRTAGGNQYGLDFYSMSQNRMSIDQSGRVGIGTPAPAFPLTVQGSGGGGVISFRNSSNELGRLSGNSASSGDLSLKSNNVWTVQISAGDVSYLNGGNVGIGTPIPSEKLDVAGNVKAAGFIGSGALLTGVVPADNSVGAQQLARDNNSLNRVSAGAIIYDGIGYPVEFTQNVNFKHDVQFNAMCELSGAIKLGTTTNPTPAAGTIRWTGTDFQGYDGTLWLSLTKGSAQGAGMVLVPGGTFTMGSSVVGGYSIPEHQVTLSSFYLGKYEVTYALWYAIRQWALAHFYYFQNAGREGDDGVDGAAPTGVSAEPVTTILWRDAIVWCNARSEYEGRAPVYTFSGQAIRDSRDTNSNACDHAVFNTAANGYRLPTEAEWEYAARYQNGSTWTPGDYASGAAANYTDAAACKDVAWYMDNSGGRTHVVERKEPNQLGIFDMSGNVWEWCWDWFASSYPGGSWVNPTGPDAGQYRVLRGGSCWFGNGDLQCALRYDYWFVIPSNRYKYSGLRCARNGQ